MPTVSPIIAWLLAYRYAIIFPLALIEGPVVMLASGFLVRLGLFDIVPIYLLLVAGDLAGDVLWYWIGFHGARPLIQKHGHFLNLTERNIERAEALFHDHQVKILFISKITMGFGFALATLVAAGAAKIPFKRYFMVNLVGGFIWAGLLLAAGYSLGHLYTQVDASLRWAFIGAMIFIILLALYGFSKFMRKRFGNGNGKKL